ncbi:MAG: zinc ribbon domain-containing protein [Limnohabitans sp.]
MRCGPCAQCPPFLPPRVSPRCHPRARRVVTAVLTGHPHPPTNRPLQVILDYFEEFRRVLYLDEFYTSQMCNICEGRLEGVPGRPRDKRCPKCGDINRDSNAAKNLERVFLEWVRVRKRPGYLTRPDGADDDARPAAGGQAKAKRGPKPAPKPEAAEPGKAKRPKRARARKPRSASPADPAAAAPGDSGTAPSARADWRPQRTRRQPARFGDAATGTASPGTSPAGTGTASDSSDSSSSSGSERSH